jgi:AmiR/NasT family two-component response regulator
VEEARAQREFEALSAGPVEAAHVALERLLQVTEASFARRAQLQQALDSRIVIEQAKGVLVERYALRPTEAFELLRDGARRSRRKIHDLARDVVDSRTTPPPIEEALRRSTPAERR